MSEYAKTWTTKISPGILERSGGRCECTDECGHHKHRCTELNGQKAKYAQGKIILTAAHLNHKKAPNTDDNLKAMCQACHLRFDAKFNAQRAIRTLRQKAKLLG